MRGDELYQIGKAIAIGYCVLIVAVIVTFGLAFLCHGIADKYRARLRDQRNVEQFAHQLEILDPEGTSELIESLKD